jgi:hypothetical protein
MLRWMSDLALVSSTLIVIALCFAAIGAGVRRVLGGHTQNLDDGFLAFWVGFAAVSWALIVWNFAFPINSTTLFALIVVAALCSAATAGSVVRSIFRGQARPRIGAILVALLATVWVASQCLAPLQSWDDVLYHIQGVAWAKAYPAIPGIANLDGRLAFNNTSFLYNALVDSWIWEGRGFHIANGPLLLVAVLQGLWAGLRWFREKPGERSPRLFGFLLFPIALYYMPEIATYSTDLPMAIALSAAMAHAAAVLGESSTSARPVGREMLVVAALLFGTAIAMKLTAAVFAGTALAVLVWRRREWAWRWSAVALLIFLGPWVARGILMSGYPLFPLPYLGLPVDWRASPEHALGELVFITYTEREFSWSFVGRGWIYLTFARNVGAVLLPALLSGAAFVLWWRQKNAHERKQEAADWWLAAPALAGIAAWMPSAPSHRYGAVLFWTLAALSVSNWMLAALRASKLTMKTARVAAVGLALSPWIASSASALVFDGASAGMQSIRRTLIGSPEVGLPSLPTDFPVQTFVTRSGFQMNIPEPRPNMRDMPNSCGNAPIPCTATPAENLELRYPGQIERGFRIRGDWNMVNWPYRWRPTFLRDWRSQSRQNNRK